MNVNNTYLIWIKNLKKLFNSSCSWVAEYWLCILNVSDPVLKGYISPSKTPNAAPVTGMSVVLTLQAVHCYILTLFTEYWPVPWYGDSVDTVEENSAIFSQVTIRWLLSARACGGVDYTDSVFRLSLKCIGSGRESRFLAPNFLTDKRPGVYFGPLLGGRERTFCYFLSLQVFA